MGRCKVGGVLRWGEISLETRGSTKPPADLSLCTCLFEMVSLMVPYVTAALLLYILGYFSLNFVVGFCMKLLKTRH